MKYLAHYVHIYTVTVQTEITLLLLYMLLYFCCCCQLYCNIVHRHHYHVTFRCYSPPPATKSLMLEFCFTHPDSIRMLLPGGNNVTIQSTSERGNEREKKGAEVKVMGTETQRWTDGVSIESEKGDCILSSSPHFAFCYLLLSCCSIPAQSSSEASRHPATCTALTHVRSARAL